MQKVRHSVAKLSMAVYYRSFDRSINWLGWSKMHINSYSSVSFTSLLFKVCVYEEVSNWSQNLTIKHEVLRKIWFNNESVVLIDEHELEQDLLFLYIQWAMYTLVLVVEFASIQRFQSYWVKGWKCCQYFRRFERRVRYFSGRVTRACPLEK